MAVSGQKPIADNIHTLRGTKTQGAQAKQRSEPVVVPANIPPPPDFLSGEALREWTRVADELKGANLLTNLDRSTLTQYCLLWGELATNPAEFTAAKHTQLRLMCVEMGWTPSARTRVSAVQESDEKPSAWADL